MDLPDSARHASAPRSSNGCWTCRLRRKKCDEKHPVCDTCTALFITCNYDTGKPEWMDGGTRQVEMAERLKSEIKTRRRRGERAHTSVAEPPTSISMALSQRLSNDRATPECDILKATPDIHNDIHEGIEPCPEASTMRPQRGPDCTLSCKDARGSIAFARADTVLLTFYLEHLFPFLFPFYRPSLLQGGRAWILEMMISSPVVRQALLCQSSYFFSLAWGSANHDVAWERVLMQTQEAFGVLRQSLQVIEGSGITGHLHGAVRTMASIMQVQRFEIAILSFNNCQSHLSAALVIFKQLLDSTGAIEPSLCFKSVMASLGPSSWPIPSESVQVPSAEQAAFRFSSTLLILDDIIASTALQEQPRLYELHHSLLGNTNGTGPLIDLEAVVGCQNWALLQIGEIAVLDAWKQRCKKAGSLDVMELVRRATAIKDLLESHLTRLETEPVIVSDEGSSLLDVLTADYSLKTPSPAMQSALVTRVWAHAALIYLFIVVSGWQPASVDVRHHVDRVIELLTRQISPPALLRTMVWPFCVAGCLVEPGREAYVRRMAERLQPKSFFGTVHKALEIMENVWRSRDTRNSLSCDLAMCFRSQGDLVLLV
jgi:C6 transcription factor Pro1